MCACMQPTRTRTQRTHALGGRYWQCVIACYSVLGAEQRDRITQVTAIEEQ